MLTWVPMLRLILFRHAEAARPADLSDHDRPLSILGHQQARKMGKYLGTEALSPDLAIVSSARRAQETWVAASKAGELATPSLTETRIYEAGIDDLLDIISQQDATIHRSLMLVGHNPAMERLTAWLTGSSDNTALTHRQKGFVVGSMAVIALPAEDWSGLHTQTGRLERFETPESV